MSVPVDLDRLAQTLTEYRFAYLLSTGDDLRPHAVTATPRIRDDQLYITSPGRRTSANVDARPTIALIWPPAQENGYSLIVDGEAAVHADVLTVTPTRAVLHRPAAPDSAPVAGSCESDCVELGAATSSSQGLFDERREPPVPGP